MQGRQHQLPAILGGVVDHGPRAIEDATALRDAQTDHPVAFALPAVALGAVHVHLAGLGPTSGSIKGGIDVGASNEKAQPLDVKPGEARRPQGHGQHEFHLLSWHFVVRPSMVGIVFRGVHHRRRPLLGKGLGRQASQRGARGQMKVVEMQARGQGAFCPDRQPPLVHVLAHRVVRLGQDVQIHGKHHAHHVLATLRHPCFHQVQRLVKIWRVHHNLSPRGGA